MRITVLGGAGAWPEPTAGCSGYVIEHEDFILVVDPGYATLLPLLAYCPAAAVDAVVVTHGHPDHCADLHPLLRARALPREPLPPLPCYAPAGALDAVLALDEPELLDGAYSLHELSQAHRLVIGPFTIDTAWLPHFLPNAGLRITAGRTTVVYTGDSGPSPDFAGFAVGADLLIAESTYATEVPARQAGFLSTAVDAAALATRAEAGTLWLTHLWPGSSPAAHLEAAARGYAGPTAVARPGLAWTSPVEPR
ncbi:MBL fold metallo-hydrolase [Actinoplanes friuliensis]|uniref:Beta-lactamase domain-containing protein n=1 Tax=Actinoplanes friuliensis DSM 7358 TaxID=1246995 RepID=U5W4R6_9ACTN|nr:MBL fold metallo-hydrolase [Actinoplanes friuliensis]AGZ44109.1 beta-lactamase domain-containing protein [Actinoplanes friuliensis DSM 7358]